MPLSLPQRDVADADSFPIDPAAVGAWLDGLWPLVSGGAPERGAREVYRGLKHSNRLHNDPERRRAVLERFVPVLHELHGQLIEPTRAQPLPLAREFARTAELVEGLLREEAFAFKILLEDSATPEPGDARRAMQALARLADVAVHGYRRVPDALLEDAYALYALAESAGLLDAVPGSGLPSLADHYRYLLLLSLADARQLRARQLPLALDFLRDVAGALELSAIGPGASAGPRLPPLVSFPDGQIVGVQADSTRPESVAALLIERRGTLHVFDTGTLLRRIDRRIARTRPVRANTLGIDTLERQTLVRLRGAIVRERVRRGARTIAHLPQPVLFGHKEIASHLLFDESGPRDEPDASGWHMVNRSAQGICLTHPACRPGTVQVGELVALGRPPDAVEERGAGGSGTARTTTLLGSVRWVHARGAEGVTLGVEYLARGAVPVSVVRAESRSPVAESALIIACKVQRAIAQTILLPPYLYASGERLLATRGGRVRELRLGGCLQSNDLFGHFLLEPSPTPPRSAVAASRRSDPTAEGR